MEGVSVYYIVRVAQMISRRINYYSYKLPNNRVKAEFKKLRFATFFKSAYTKRYVPYTNTLIFSISFLMGALPSKSFNNTSAKPNKLL